MKAQYISQNWLRSPYERLAGDPVDEALSDAWSDRSCGLACVSMILLRRLGVYVPYRTLLEAGLTLNAYGPKGWIHAGMCRLLARFGVTAQAVPASRQEVASGLQSGRLIIVSVSHRLPTDGQRGGHLVLLHGLPACSGGPYVAFSDPSRWGETHGCVSADRLFASYSGRAIVCAP